MLPLMRQKTEGSSSSTGTTGQPGGPLSDHDLLAGLLHLIDHGGVMLTAEGSSDLRERRVSQSDGGTSP
jgi:hypothetical protein